MIFWKCEPWRFTRLKIYKMGCAGNQKTQSSRSTQSTLNTPSIQKKTQSMNDKSRWIRVKNSINEKKYSMNENKCWKDQVLRVVGVFGALGISSSRWEFLCPRGFVTCLFSGICNPRVDNCGYSIRAGRRPAVSHPVDCKSTGTKWSTGTKE